MQAKLFYFILIGILLSNFSQAEATAPVIESITLYNGQAGTPTQSMTPSAEMRLQIKLSDADGFNDIYSVTFFFWHYPDSQTSPDNPYTHATYQWLSDTNTWKLIGPTGTTWAIKQESCSAPSPASNTTTPQTLTLTFTPGIVSVYDKSPNWQLDIFVDSGIGDTLGSITLRNNSYSRMELLNPRAEFQANLPGQDNNPMISPSSGQISLHLTANSPYELLIKADDFSGSLGTISLPGPLKWATNTYAPRVATKTYQLVSNYPSTDEDGQTEGIYLWLNYPDESPPGSYSSQLFFQMTAADEYISTGSVNLAARVLRQDLILLSPPSTGTAGIATPFIVNRQDETGQPILSGTVSVYLAAAGSGQFRLSPGGSPTNTLVIPDGSSTAPFFFYAEQPDNYTITVTSNGLKGVSHSIAIIPDPARYIQLKAENIPFTFVHPGQTRIETLKISCQNAYPCTQTITSLQLANTTLGSGSQANLDAEISLLYLYTTSGQLVATASFTNGLASFSQLNLPIPPQGSVTISIIYDLSLDQAKDGDVIDTELIAIGLSTSTVTKADWPLNSFGYQQIDGFIARQVISHPVPIANLPSGSRNNTILQITIPPNGYDRDTLKAISLQNAGTAKDQEDIKSVRCWLRGTPTDIPLGSLAWSGDRWQISGLSQPIPAQMGAEILITADIADSARQGATVKMKLPINGIEVSGQNYGPIDQAIENLYTQQINVVDKVVFESLPLLTQTKRPGQKGEVLSLAVTNLYQTPRTITSLSLTNISLGPGSQTELDSEIGLVYLIEESSTIAVGSFRQGKTILNLKLPLPAQETRHLHIFYDLSLTKAKDSDLIDCAINSPTEISFEDATSVSGLFPLNSSGEDRVDGLVKAQIINYGAPPITVPANEQDVLVMDVTIPGNGYQSDRLKAMKVENGGLASYPQDIRAIKLWVDDGNGSFEQSDTYLGPASWDGRGWQFAGLSLNIPPYGQRIFVSADISGSPTDISTIQMKIPVDGLELESTNDGPLDSEVINPSRQIISLAPLIAYLKVVAKTMAINQSSSITMVVRNTSPDDLGTVSPTGLRISGSATLISGPEPALLSLPAGKSDEIVWHYLTNQSGSLTFYGAATTTNLSSLEAVSNPILVQDIPVSLNLTHLASMPVSVNSGQTDILPISFIFSNQGETKLIGDIKITRLSFQVNAFGGAGTSPTNAITRVTLIGDGVVYASKASIEKSGQIVDLPLDTPLIIPQDRTVIARLKIDIPSGSTTSRFKIRLPDSSSLTALDANSGSRIEQINGDFVNMSSGEAIIQAEPTSLRVEIPEAGLIYANRGQSFLRAVRLKFTNLSPPAAAEIKITHLRLQLRSSQLSITPSAVISRAYLQDQDGHLYAQCLPGAEFEEILLSFDQPMAIAGASSRELFLHLDLKPEPLYSSFTLSIATSSSIIARDSNTGKTVPTVAAFPLISQAIIFQKPAQTVTITCTSLLPETVYQGQSRVRCLRLNLANPGDKDTASIILKKLNLSVQDMTGTNLGTASQAISWLRVDGTESLINLTTPNPVPISLNIVVPPGSVTTLELQANISDYASADSLRLIINSQSDLTIIDANNSSLIGTIGSAFPIQSGAAWIQSLSSRLEVKSESKMPVNTYCGQERVKAINLTFTNPGGTKTSAIEVRQLRLSLLDRFNKALVPAQIISRVELSCGQEIIYSCNSGSGSSVDITLSPALRVLMGKPVSVEVWLDMVNAPASEHFKLGLDSLLAYDSLSGQTITVTGSLPLLSESAIIFQPGLDETFTNYPNPFEAGLETTTIAYYLTQDAYVTMKVYTIIGDLVVTILDNQYKLKGIHEEDRWDGRNADGQPVLNGVYLCQIKVNYASGGSANRLRKIAVLR